MAATVSLEITPDMLAVLLAGNPELAQAAQRFAEGQTDWPQRWQHQSLAELLPYQVDPKGYPIHTDIPGTSLWFGRCGGCYDQAWIGQGDFELYALSTRQSGFVQVASGVMVRPTKRGVLVLHRKPYRAAKYCSEGGD